MLGQDAFFISINEEIRTDLSSKYDTFAFISKKPLNKINNLESPKYDTLLFIYSSSKLRNINLSDIHLKLRESQIAICDTRELDFLAPYQDIASLRNHLCGMPKVGIEILYQ